MIGIYKLILIIYKSEKYTSQIERLDNSGEIDLHKLNLTFDYRNAFLLCSMSFS